jgi:hypothetical protein
MALLYTDEYSVYAPPPPHTRLVFEGMERYLQERGDWDRQHLVQPRSERNRARTRRTQGSRHRHFDDPRPSYSP